ncbi:MAG: hypothetical protein ACK5RO_09765, partial [Pseudobdellovibrionaceae bacterium]
MRLLFILLFLFGSPSFAQVYTTDHFLNFWIDSKYQKCNDQSARYDASRHARSPGFNSAGKISAIAAATNQNVDHPCYQICGQSCFQELESIFGADRKLTSILSRCVSHAKPQATACENQAHGFREKFADLEEKIRNSCSITSRGFTSSE